MTTAYFSDSKVESKVLHLLLKFGKSAGTIIPVLMPDDFYTAGHLEIYERIREQIETYGECSVAQLIGKNNPLRHTGALERILSETASPLEMGMYIRTLKQRTHARRILSAAVTIALDNKLSGDRQVNDVISAVEQELQSPCLPLDDFNSLVNNRVLVAADDVLQEISAKLEGYSLRNHIKEWVRSLSMDHDRGQLMQTGIEELDFVTNGLLRGQLYVVSRS